MAQEFDVVRANLLPVAGTVTDNDMILIVQGGRPKRALPSVMKGKQGDPGLSAFLGVNTNYILWKQGASGTWQNLLEIERLRGPKGEKPIFRKVGGTLQMKYEGEPDTAWLNIFDRDELKMKFSDLTADEVSQLKLHFSDLTTEDVKELQKPAREAATKLTADVEKLEKRAETVISDVSESKTLADAATQAATDATALANKATGLANEATDKANTAAENADEKAGLAEAAAGKATTSAGLADGKAGLADTAAENADAKAGLADAAATLANASAEKADKATQDALDATQAAIDSTAKANTAADNADEKAGLANTAADSANAATEKANTSADNADRATELANVATQNADVATGRANTAAGNADTATGNADAATEKANTAAENADKATDAATKAANRATTLSNNRDKIVAGYWWKYDETLKDYVTTGIRATGETGQGLNIVGRYATAELLQAAYPDGVVGCFEVGNESPYEIWYYDAPASEWRNSGRLQGPRGISAFQVWQLQPGNEDKTELDFFHSLCPYIGKNLNWWLNGVDLGIKAPGTDAHSPYMNPDTKKWVVFNDEIQEYEETDSLAEGISSQVEIVKHTPTEFIVKFISADGVIISPNLIVRATGNSGVIDIDHEPTAEDTHYTLEGVDYPYAIGQEVRFRDGSDITFFKCYDNSDAGAIWEEVGSGGALVSNIYLQGANYYNNSVQIIKQGYLKNE